MVAQQRSKSSNKDKKMAQVQALAIDASSIRSKSTKTKVMKEPAISPDLIKVIKSKVTKNNKSNNHE